MMLQGTEAGIKNKLHFLPEKRLKPLPLLPVKKKRINNIFKTCLPTKAGKNQSGK
jgi:hypothetical protein